MSNPASPYNPDQLPLVDLDYRLLLPLVGVANAALARYDGLLQSIPNPAIMLSPLTTQEAVLSSKIEGTQATVDEVLEQEAGLLKQGEKFQDIQEISNYRQALYAAREHLKDYPIRLSFVRELHRILMSSVRGQDKTPGEFRKDQNWIGKHGCTMEQATFVPPNPLRLPDHLQAWETYMDSNDVDFLLQTAVVHAQFELLHPFKDGNGRIGRILIPLFLYQKRALSQPMFYLSEYLEANREEYYTVHLLDAIFSKPIFRSTDLAQQLLRDFEIHEKTTTSLLRQLREADILRELQPGSGRRPATLCFPSLINLAEGKEVL